VSFAVGGQADDARDARRVEFQQKLAALSPDERQVLTALVGGRGNNSIANDLASSVRTVEVHRANVMTKMQARSLSHLVRMMLLAHPDRPTS
jgi:two-component system, LuxR family, response regulator FixJ